MPASAISLEKSNRFRWLHFSDIHVGMKGQQFLWPRFGHLLDTDLETALNRSGNIDLIVFSGDMVQMGTREEFDKFDEIMGGIVDRIAEFQSRPQIIALPGNHDLVRPDRWAGQSVALSRYWEEPELREHFWDTKGGDYRSFIAEAFANFTDWQNRKIEDGSHVRPITIGILPGDASYVVETASGRLGVAALNSTWLQLQGGDYTGHLHVDVRQLHAISDANPDQWAKANDVSILVAHQPPSWLHASSPSTWENDINPAGRFDVHMYGHMHEPDTSTVKHGGGQTRRNLQAASLFGLEVYKDSIQRLQGYSVCEVAVREQEKTLTVWPRRLFNVTGGEQKLGPDQSQDLDEETASFSIHYTMGPKKKAQPPAIPVDPISTAAQPDDEDANATQRPQFNLESIRVALPTNKAHLSIRQAERDLAAIALQNDRIVWVAADWGLGHEGFLFSICERLGITPASAFALDFNGYRNRNNFFERLQALHRASFQEICEAVAEAGPSILIFDDLDFPSSCAVDANFELDVEGLAQTVSDFADKSMIIIRTRRPKRSATFEQVELKALDEVEVGIYATASEIGGERFSRPAAASKLFRHTDGVPNRIDVALRDLEIITLDELIESNPDFTSTGGTLMEAPPALVATVSELRASEDRQEQRAWNLLLALSALPHGEQLGRLKRFLGPHPITLTHARALMDRSLVNSVSMTTFEGMGTEGDKALVVPRSVREYVRNEIDDKTADEFDLKALDLHFGDKWTTGDIHGSATGKRVRQPLCNAYEIQNATTLILRVVRRSIDGASATSTESMLRLAIALVDALEDGKHFRTITGFCEDMLALIENDEQYDKETNVLRYEYARSLRMTSRHAEARANFDALDEELLTKQQKQSVQLGIALCFDMEGDEAGAADAAKKAIAIDRKSWAALHAQSILAEQIQDSDERLAELRKILSKAQKDQHHSLVNTINLSLAAERKRRRLSSDDLLKQIIVTQKKTGDFYNAARAIVRLASQDGAAARLTPEEQGHLAAAYNYLYHERLYNLFDKCHAALWKLFSHKGDSASLLNLFRHSSFIWRLNGREEQETKYLAELAKKFGDLISAGVSGTNRDGAYLIVRVSMVMGQLSAPDEGSGQAAGHVGE
jgi:predicted phosphodiesterase/tetratricopeptide (TPR) repeat protein